MAKIILLEGPDGSGKTYLSNKIVEKYKASYIHSSRPKDKDDIHYPSIYTWTAAELIKKSNCDVILDRHFLSQIIYQEVFEKGKSSENFSSPCFMNGFDKIVICLPEKEKYLEKFNSLKNEREELYDNMNEIYEAYKNLYYGIEQNLIKNQFFNEVIKNGGLKMLNNVVLYDMYNDNIEEIIEKVMKG